MLTIEKVLMQWPPSSGLVQTGSVEGVVANASVGKNNNASSARLWRRRESVVFVMIDVDFGCRWGRAISDGEAGATTARALGVGVAELKAAAHHVVLKVDLCPVEVQVTFGIAVDAYAVLFEDAVVGVGLIDDIEHVVEARATTGFDPYAQAVAGRIGVNVVFLHHLNGFLCGVGCQFNHIFDLYGVW